MLTYSLVNLNRKSIYEYLYECIRDDILRGTLKPGDKLPSKRAFAKNHGISVITVENAYGLLISEGYIYSETKRGYFVADIHSQPSGDETKSGLIVRSENASETILYDLVSNHTLSDNFPFSTWTRLMRRIISEETQSLMQAPPAGGVMELREAIAGHLKAFRGMNVSPEQIVIGAGSEYLYGLLVQLLGRDKLYALENPGYRKVRSVYAAQDVEVVNIPIDHEGIRLDILKNSHADILQVSPSHHFPTGIVMPVNRRYGLLEWANERDGRFILEDDYDSELRLAGKPIPSLFSIDLSGKVIYLNTFTKSLSPTIRISYMVLPEHLLEQFYARLGFYSCTVSNFEQYTVARFIGEGFFEKHINRMRKLYREVRDSFLDEIRTCFPVNSVEIKEEEAGLHFLLTVHSDYSDAELTRRARAAGIRISFLSDYFDSSDGDELQNIFPPHTAVVNYSGIALEQIPDAVRRLSDAWELSALLS